MALSYSQYLAANRLTSSATAALAWLKSGNAPIGTPIPAALRSQFGGQGSLSALTPGVDWSNAVLSPAQQVALGRTTINQLDPQYLTLPPAAPTPPATSQNPTPNAGDPYTFTPPPNPYQPQIDYLTQAMANLPLTYDPQRQAAAAQAASSLQASGLVDFPGAYGAPRLVQGPNGPQVQYDYTQVAGTATDPTTGQNLGHTYQVVQGADGRAYLQAFTNVAHGSASRGVFSGSQVEGQQQQARQSLDYQRAAAYQQAQQAQAASVASQQGQLGSLFQQRAADITQGAQAVNQTVAGWSVPQSYTDQLAASRAAPTLSDAAYRTPTQPTNPSPLTSLTGGQRTITGKVASASTAGAQSLWGAAKGLRTKKATL